MRICDGVVYAIVVALSVGIPAARGFDGTRSLATEPISPAEAFRSGNQALRAGENSKGITALEYAADQGLAVAQWQLGRMYAKGDGVPRNDLRAFEYFGRIANTHADDSPYSPEARLVANAFVALAQYYLDGIPNSDVKPDPTRARELLSYAASYFGDPEAQYSLGRLYLDGTPRDPRQAGRWLALAANKGQHQAQAVLGHMLFKGELVARQAARGLMWLTLACENASASEKWITDLCAAAFRQASDDERAMARRLMQRWVTERWSRGSEAANGFREGSTSRPRSGPADR
jgi:uncharacterized protein